MMSYQICKIYVKFYDVKRASIHRSRLRVG